MEMLLSPEADDMLEAAGRALRPMKVVEYVRLATEGFFDDEKVELLYGMVVPMAPIDQDHSESVSVIYAVLLRHLEGRARVYGDAAFAASDYSMPQPDLFVVPPGSYWDKHHSKAWLVIEVAKSSLRRDRAKRGIYQRAPVDEYWIVNHIDGCVEVYRDSRNGTWQSVTKHVRGETVSPLAFPDVQIPVAEILPPVQAG